MTDRILIVGASGFLGANLALCAAGDNEVVAQMRQPMPSTLGVRTVRSELLGPRDLSRLLADVRPTCVVNCAALADVDHCERDPALAYELNAAFPRSLAIECAAQEISLIHISTDAVFGMADGPFTTEDPVDPINEYGRSKAAGERAVLDELPSAIVARTNIYGWSPTGTRSLLEFFVGALEHKRQVLGFADVLFRPTSVLGLWDPLHSWMADSRVSGVGGVRHATGSELVSKYEFGRRVAEAFGLDATLIQQASVDDGGLRALRSRCLDVLPSAVPAAHPSNPAQPGLNASLDRLRLARAAGWRDRLSEFANIARSEQHA